jgi:hypothetical protein
LKSGNDCQDIHLSHGRLLDCLSRAGYSQSSATASQPPATPLAKQRPDSPTSAFQTSHPSPKNHQHKRPNPRHEYPDKSATSCRESDRSNP